MERKTSGLNNTSRHGLEPGRWADLDYGSRYRRAGGHAAGFSHQRGSAGTTGEGDYQH
jgi:hypothetical protein